jgi:hypothetical protein
MEGPPSTEYGLSALVLECHYPHHARKNVTALRKNGISLSKLIGQCRKSVVD